ncbi:MAG: 1-deoxy-D-xylulose-5-phosphate reductoisomerase [Candidatus Omnitrophica bacterium]|nr:1-deoxy-D-xylulose-5-phosphate reductoisomerase [Candidatus Omnitrophota bacterium]
MKTLSVVGSTGSIGQKVLEIVRLHPERFRIAALAARKNTKILLKQAKEFRPRMVCVFDEIQARGIKSSLERLGVRLVTGEEGLLEVSAIGEAQQVIFSLVGAKGLPPIFEAIRKGKDVAIANKEPLVMAGELLVSEAAKRRVKLLPIDSEHSGLWQCLEGRIKESVRKLILTSSGGPFRKRKGSLAKVTVKEALRHPKWRMGPKITVDSATLMNKGLEVIEASNLFGLGVDRVEVLIHPEAVIHALVEFIDGSHLAQLAVTDMRVPIQYALSFPERLNHLFPHLDLVKVGSLHFEKPNLKKFPCLEFGYEAQRRGGTMPAVLNGANEIAVEKFLTEEIPFLGIPKMIEKVMQKHRVKAKPGLADILEADQWARKEATKLQ